jgi:hypothetical protein
MVKDFVKMDFMMMVRMYSAKSVTIAVRPVYQLLNALLALLDRLELNQMKVIVFVTMEHMMMDQIQFVKIVIPLV